LAAYSVFNAAAVSTPSPVNPHDRKESTCRTAPSRRGTDTFTLTSNESVRAPFNGSRGRDPQAPFRTASKRAFVVGCEERYMSALCSPATTTFRTRLARSRPRGCECPNGVLKTVGDRTSKRLIFLPFLGDSEGPSPSADGCGPWHGDPARPAREAGLRHAGQQPGALGGSVGGGGFSAHQAPRLCDFDLPRIFLAFLLGVEIDACPPPGTHALTPLSRTRNTARGAMGARRLH